MIALGPETKKFSEFLTQAENIPLKDILQMENLVSDASQDSRHKALYNIRMKDDMLSGMMIEQVLDMYSDYYPRSIINAALGIASKHVIDDEYSLKDYHRLTAPWCKVKGQLFPSTPATLPQFA